ncbi:MAG: DNA recombination protein RmuC [Bacteroidales bacterium]|nr:DNA recombination protein RmuC [Bacteroidales bacterium]
METSTLLIIAVAVAVAAIVALVVTALMASSEKYRLIRAYEAEKDEKDAEIGSLNAQKAKLEATINERYEAEQRREADRKEQYQKDLEAMKDTFKALSAENSAAFKRESSSSIEEILKPFKERFDAFDKSVRESDEKALERTTRLTTSIEEVLKHSRMVGDEAKNLANALTGYSKVQGNFGEMLLADLLKNSGLVEGQHFFTQSVMTDEAGHEIKSDTGGTMIPDVLVCYPDDTTVVIDSKVTLTAFNRYMNSETVEDRQKYAAEVVASIKKHVEELKNKDYASYIPKGKTKVDYNIMFIPLEGAFRLMLDAEPRLWQAAKDNNVLIVSQMTLIIVLNMIQMSWRQADQEKNIREVYDTASEMMSQIKAWLDSYVKIGENLEKASAAYSEATRKLNGSNQSVVRKIEKLEKNYGIVARRSSRGKIDVSGRKTGPESVIPASLAPPDEATSQCE